MRFLSKFLSLSLVIALLSALAVPAFAAPETDGWGYKDSIETDLGVGETTSYSVSSNYCYIELDELIEFTPEAVALSDAGQLTYAFDFDLSCSTSRTFTRIIEVQFWDVLVRFGEGGGATIIEKMDEMHYVINESNYIVPATTYSYTSGILQVPPGADMVKIIVQADVHTRAHKLGIDYSFSLQEKGSSSMVAANQLFSDVEKSDFFYEPVGHAYQNQYMNGTGATKFSPEKAITRGQFVTALHRLSGEEAQGSHTFTDVEEGSYYEDAVIWANANGIVTGVSDTAFDPDASITREQMAAILYRFAQYKGFDTTAQGDLSAFRDADQVSGYAQEAMIWANQTGLILGKKADLLAPQGIATRGQAVTILYRGAINVFA